jgi:ribonuclease P protein component
MTFDYRLKKEKDFKLVFNKGKRLFCSDLTIIYFKADSLKAGFAVSKKHGKSVQRNRIKRLLRESFRSFAPLFRENFFFVFIPKVKDEYSLKTFKDSMKYLFIKGGFIEKC